MNNEIEKLRADNAPVAECIDRAAIKCGNTVYSVAKPGRHLDVYRSVAAAGYDWIEAHQGFCTNFGRFVDRIEARSIALAADQIIAGRRDNDGTPYKSVHPQLFSEDVW